MATSGGQGASGVVTDAALPAGPTGWTLVGNADDLESGGTARLMEIPLSDDSGFVTVYQTRLAGDAFPRLVIVSDGSVYIGDGTFNPLQTTGTYASVGLIPDGNAGLYVNSRNARLGLDDAGNALLKGVVTAALQVSASTLSAVTDGMSTTPTDSDTATTAFGALTVGTPLQSALAYDVLVSGTITITAATAGTLSLGVSPGATPVTSPITGAITTATNVIISFSAVVPAGYYLSLVSAGTITLGSPVIVATPL